MFWHSSSRSTIATGGFSSSLVALGSLVVEGHREHWALIHPRIARETDSFVARPVVLRTHHIPDSTTLVRLRDEARPTTSRHLSKADRHRWVGEHVRTPVAARRSGDEDDLLAHYSEPQLGRALFARLAADRDDVTTLAFSELREPTHAQPAADVFDERSGGAVRNATMTPRTRIIINDEMPTN